VRIYSESEQENLRTLGLLKDWTSEGLLSESQHLAMKQDVECGLRRTNFFLRLVFFLFTLISVSAAVGLFLVGVGNNTQATGVFLLLSAALCYWGAEAAVASKRFYRHGVEEALAVLSVLFLCVGLELVFFGSRTLSSWTESFVPACGAATSFLIWRRFGFQYFFLAALIFAATLPWFWTSSPDARHLIVAAFYASGLLAVIHARRAHRFDYRDDEYSIAEALLWLGLYLSMNLQLSSIDQLRKWWTPSAGPGGFSREFYWSTYALTWCLPIGMLRRALKRTDRAVTAFGVAAAVLTLVTNKPYLGWQRHTWDPILLGVLLTGAAVAVKRWLTTGPRGIRHGFTAERLSARDKQAKDLLSTFGGAVLPSPAFTPAPGSEPTFSGGDSGGGGATSDF
jgi:hypothetical protein